MAVSTTENPRIGGSRISASDPAVDGVAFTGTADVTLETISRGIYIASDGDITVDMAGGVPGKTAQTNLTFVGVKGGTILPITITKVYDVGTTVSGVILL
jgi:hypothetical protein